jgi:hypothetical protein
LERAGRREGRGRREEELLWREEGGRTRAGEAGGRRGSY